MTRTQFARAVDAGEKWVENAARLLPRQFSLTVEEARWLGLVRLLTGEFGVPLRRAGELASEALAYPASTRALPLVVASDGSAALVLDLARYHSTFSARLAAALREIAPRRGRPPGRRNRAVSATSTTDPLAAAVAYGVDLSLLRDALRRSPAERLARLDDNAAFVRALKPVQRAASAHA